MMRSGPFSTLPTLIRRGALLLPLLLAGCGTMPSLGGPMDRWFGGDEPETPQTLSGITYVEPRPGTPTGLKTAWNRGLASAPGDEMLHPQEIAVDGDSVFVATYQGELLRVDRNSGREVWSVDFDVPLRGGPGVSADGVFVGTAYGEMIAVERADGALRWRERLPTAVASAPAISSKLAIVLTINNQTFALDTATGTRIWRHATLPQALSVMDAATPTVSGGLVFVGYSTGELFVLDVESGAQVWSDILLVMAGRSELDLLQDVDASVVVAPGANAAFAANHQGQIMAFVPGTGEKYWTRGMSVLRKPLLAGDKLFVSDMDGNVAGLKVSDGSLLWRTQVSDGVLTAPVLFGDRVVVADDKGRLVTLNPATGQVAGLDKLGEPVFADPVTSSGDLYLWTNKGNLYRFN